MSMNVYMENSEPGSLRYEQVNRGIDNIIDYLPRISIDAGYEDYSIESMQIHFDISQLPGGLPDTDYLDTSFLPPDIEIKVVERPRVIIKYVGGPLYIPKSADPDYVPPEENNQVFDGKPNLDVKA
jgi:hypothetical protein